MPVCVLISVLISVLACGVARGRGRLNQASPAHGMVCWSVTAQLEGVGGMSTLSMM